MKNRGRASLACLPARTETDNLAAGRSEKPRTKGVWLLQAWVAPDVEDKLRGGVLMGGTESTGEVEYTSLFLVSPLGC